MSEVCEDLAGLVETIVSQLVEFPDELEVSAANTDEGGVLVEVGVNPDDVGKVIGRQGRVIKSIRTLARAAASHEGMPVDVELID